MKPIVVIGSGASGVHFALTALKRGRQVVMLDVGKRGKKEEYPEKNVPELKRTLADPTRYFLGDDFRAVLLPKSESEYYGFPPGKSFVFERPAQLHSWATGFSPLFSFAQGGLAEAWTAGAYPFSASELEPFPFSYAELKPFYAEVAERIGINGAEDDLARFFPMPSPLQEPLRLDEHSRLLFESYQRKREYLNDKLGCYLGRSRVATWNREQGDRQACTYCGRCLWGCPREALYTPSITLKECLRYPNFKYHPGFFAHCFGFDKDQRVTHVIGESLATGEMVTVPADVLVLAAGTLMSSKIFLESIRRATGNLVKLRGLMDNRQIMVPFVNPRMIGRQYDPASYQYHQLAMGLEGASAREYVHCQITTLKTALIHPLVQGAPFDLRTALYLFRHLHAALGLVNVNLCDTRREDNYVTLQSEAVGAARLVVNYAPPASEARLLTQVVGRVKKALRSLGCFAVPGMTRVRPMGASVHYCGTIPASNDVRPLTASRDCRSHDFANLFFVDGTTLPFLPAKNLTYTLMANAVRVAERVAEETAPLSAA